MTTDDTTTTPPAAPRPDALEENTMSPPDTSHLTIWYDGHFFKTDYLTDRMAEGDVVPFGTAESAVENLRKLADLIEGYQTGDPDAVAYVERIEEGERYFRELIGDSASASAPSRPPAPVISREDVKDLEKAHRANPTQESWDRLRDAYTVITNPHLFAQPEAPAPDFDKAVEAIIGTYESWEIDGGFPTELGSLAMPRDGDDAQESMFEDARSIVAAGLTLALSAGGYRQPAPTQTVITSAMVEAATIAFFDVTNRFPAFGFRSALYAALTAALASNGG